MTPDEPDCPLCKSPASMVEHLAHQWRYCSACGRCFLVNAAGELVATAPTDKCAK